MNSKRVQAVVKAVEIALANDGALTSRFDMEGVWKNEILVEDASHQQYILTIRKLNKPRFPRLR